MQVLTARGRFDALDRAGKLVRGQSIGQTYSQVASGAAELGFVALAQVLTAEGIPGSHWIPPRDAYAPIGQAAVLLTRAEQPEAGRAFLDWLRRPQTREFIERAGYGVD